MSLRINSNKKINLQSYSEEEMYPEYIETIYEFTITAGFKSIRIDKYLTQAIENSTRTRVQKAIDANRVFLNDEILTKANYKIRAGDKIVVKIHKSPPLMLRPENIPIDIVYEDEWLMVVNKPAGMVVHPGLGNRYGTLVNALLWHFGVRNPLQIEFDDEEAPDEATIEGKLMASDKVRPGIVHRIDKDTSGIIVIAKDPHVLTKLSEQFAARTTDRYYYALAWGKFKNDKGAYEGDIGRSPKNRKLYGVVNRNGKNAKTNWEVINQFDLAALLRLKLHTGRTHQIRVHCSHDNHPLLGDKEYGGDRIAYGNDVPEFKKAGQKILDISIRQMLHAKTLGFYHPIKNEFMRFDSELPEDFKNVIKVLEQISIDRSKTIYDLI